MPTIYEQTAGSLIPQPNRTVATFDSGLIRVDQEFVCTTASAETNRLSLAVGNSFPGETSPAIDGLFIFPSPQESRTGDGLTKFMVSGYGRATDQLISQRRGTTSTVIKSSFISGELTVDTRDFAIITTNSLIGKTAILDEDGLTYAQLNLDPTWGEPLAVIPVDADDVILEAGRTINKENGVNWDGQIYEKIVTTVTLTKTVSTNPLKNLIAYYTYSTPVIGIDFSTSYGNFTELGINVSAPIGNPIVSPV